MDKILDETKRFVSKIKESHEYKAFQTAKRNLELRPELLLKVDAFRRESFKIQMQHDYGQYNSFEQILNLKREFEEILCNPLFKRFLDIELTMTKMLNAVYTKVAEEIDFDVDFLLH